ncbi:hypothetical protein Desde_0858 [Desulfitobacterium dehalogenans ATCC 51507]|uniref:Uncharacterized protein n=1 Tax=Desulfitobacterium dehalogenans (strain ATCC 51507 / DSM 9161 / JW/IU-DC1) TaxID=756499 RepID=I4A5R4_DESDJ|nr:hypothetical protein Desde_0858 [Desulfitobacterium dehalogenans ATCC 51507]
MATSSMGRPTSFNRELPKLRKDECCSEASAILRTLYATLVMLIIFISLGSFVYVKQSELFYKIKKDLVNSPRSGKCACWPGVQSKFMWG